MRRLSIKYFQKLTLERFEVDMVELAHCLEVPIVAVFSFAMYQPYDGLLIKAFRSFLNTLDEQF